MIDHYAVLGPAPCIGCRRPVVWERVGGKWWLGELTKDTIRVHKCRARCLDRMRGGEVCARLEGHSGSHSSRKTLDRIVSWTQSRAAA